MTSQTTLTLNVSHPLAPIDEALQKIFSSPQEETRLQRARRIMGVSVESTSDEDLEIFLTEFQYLIDGWLDAFEQEVFDGLTLNQVLGQG